MKKRILCLVLTCVMTFSLLININAEDGEIAGESVPDDSASVSETLDDTPKVFSDVTEDKWYYEYVSELAAGGVIEGYDDGSFKPDRSVTCAEALKLVMHAVGYSEIEPDKETDHWALGYYNYAIKIKYMTATDMPKTSLDKPASRLLIAKIAANALGLDPTDAVKKVTDGRTDVETGMDIESPFSDTDNRDVLLLWYYKIIEGSEENGTLVYRPDDGILRSEISAIVWRIFKSPLVTERLRFGVYWVDKLDGVPAGEYDRNLFAADGSIMVYGGDAKSAIGIDVSSYQGNVDWQKVADSGIKFVILRLGYRGYTEGQLFIDEKFDVNFEGAREAGLDIGVYIFSQATNEAEAKEEAELVLDTLDGRALEYPIVFDWEPFSTTAARTYGMSGETLTDCALAFCRVIERADYTPMLYMNLNTGYLKYQLDRTTDYDIWLAQYADQPSFYYDFRMWQYSSTGRVDGIAGNVDMNICMRKY